MARIFINREKEETPDGFRVDVDGNLWCGWGMSPALDGVKVFNPAGKAIGFIALPERAANVTQPNRRNTSPARYWRCGPVAWRGVV